MSGDKKRHGLEAFSDSEKLENSKQLRSLPRTWRAPEHCPQGTFCYVGVRLRLEGRGCHSQTRKHKSDAGAGLEFFHTSLRGPRVAGHMTASLLSLVDSPAPKMATGGKKFLPFETTKIVVSLWQLVKPPVSKSRAAKKDKT